MRCEGRIRVGNTELEFLPPAAGGDRAAPRFRVAVHGTPVGVTRLTLVLDCRDTPRVTLEYPPASGFNAPPAAPPPRPGWLRRAWDRLTRRGGV